MNDEDFVMGYCVGFNDGAQSGGGGSGGEYSDIVIYKQYDFGGSGYGIAIPDFTKGTRFIIPYTLAMYQSDYSDISTKKYGPANSWEVYPLTVCMTFNGQVRGIFSSSDYASYWENYSYVNGAFRLDSDKFAPTLISAELYKNGSDIKGKVEYKLSVNGSAKTIDKVVLIGGSGISLSRMSAPTGHGGDAFFRAWSIAYLKNGITGVCDPVNPYAE